jgi:long-chain acyl-CoA synthetase
VTSDSPTAVSALKATWAAMTAPGAPFEMADTTVGSVPVRVFKNAPQTMRDFWMMGALRELDRTLIYLVFEDERYSYADIGADVRSLAHALRNEYGVQEGDRVAISMRNYPEWVTAYWATLCIGATVVGMNAWWTPPEMEYGLTDSAPKVLIADDERLERVNQVLGSLRAKAPLAIIRVRSNRTDGELADSKAWSEVVDRTTAPDTMPDATIDPNDDACIFYTSGTTGFPKGAQLTHRGCVNNVFNVVFWGATSAGALASLNPGPSPAAPTPGTPAPQSVFMAPTPLFHVTANNCILHPGTLAGAKVVFMHKWDAGRALELIEREGVTNFSGVPTMSRELLAHPDWATRNTSTMVGLGGGGAPVQPDLVGKIGKSLEGRGAPSTGYGLTETHGIVTANGAAFFLDKPASCGPVMPTFDAQLRDEDGNVLPSDGASRGVLWVRGSGVIKGYLNRPEATAEAIQDGWFNTGDIAQIDEDGFVFIVDRAKDMVLRGGENVYCSEVEVAIYEHPDVVEAAVFGVPDERLGEAVAAGVLVREGSSLDQAGLQEYLTGKLAAYKIPSQIWFLDEAIPRNANGKLVKRELRSKLIGA